MESIIYIFLPMSLLFKFFVNKNDKGYEIVIKYLAVSLINLIICGLINKFYFHYTKLFDTKISFFLKYMLLSFVVSIIMVIIYNIFVNFWKVKIEVVHEKESKRN